MTSVLIALSSLAFTGFALAVALAGALGRIPFAI